MKVVFITEKAGPVVFGTADCATIGTPDDLGKQGDADLYIDLDFEPEEMRIRALSRMASPVVVNAVTSTIAGFGYPFIRINGWPGMLGRTIHELVVPDERAATQIARLYGNAGLAYRFAPDIPGMVTARILAVLINEAWYTWESGVSSKEEIDTAMKLGTNYPLGPFEWGARIGLHKVVELLEVMGGKDPRYLPAESLKKAALVLKYD